MDDCPGDLNYDGVVDVSDLLILLGSWGPCDPNDSHPIFCRADINCDGVVDVSDLLALLGSWGVCHGFPNTSQPDTLVEALEAAGLSQSDWDAFMDVMTTSEDARERENWRCWMENYLMLCVNCPTCPGSDPFR